MDVSLIYKWMEPLSCLPLFAFWNLVICLQQSSQHRNLTRTDTVVFYMGRNKVFNLWPTIYKQYWIVLQNQLHFLRMFQSQFQLRYDDANIENVCH